jgi:hypothetical protein
MAHSSISMPDTCNECRSTYSAPGLAWTCRQLKFYLRKFPSDRAELTGPAPDAVRPSPDDRGERRAPESLAPVGGAGSHGCQLGVLQPLNALFRGNPGDGTQWRSSPSREVGLPRDAPMAAYLRVSCSTVRVATDGGADAVVVHCLFLDYTMFGLEGM